jgi:predicted DNA-binding transcriptional regulator AlpA
MNQLANKDALDRVARRSQAGHPNLILLDRREVARLLKVHAATITVMVAKGRFPPPRLKDGRVVRWTLAQVRDYIGGRRPPPPLGPRADPAR